MWALFLSAAVGAQALPPHNWMTPPDLSGETDRKQMTVSGNQLFESCQKSREACVWYVKGVTDGQLAVIIATSRTRAYCIPLEATAEQTTDIVLKFMNDHP